jgi:hypothetical protein
MVLDGSFNIFPVFMCQSIQTQVLSSMKLPTQKTVYPGLYIDGRKMINELKWIGGKWLLTDFIYYPGIFLVEGLRNTTKPQ